MADADTERDTARADLCRFLAACYYEPGAEFEEERLFASMQDAANRLGPDFAAGASRLGEAFEADGTGELLVDYTRLFLGPVDALASPYGSVWLGTEKALMQDSTMAVLAIYAEGGFEIAEDFRELPDHIAAELEFLYLLIYRENQARRGGEPEAHAAAAGLKQRFLDAHLAPWTGAFTGAVRAGAKCAFYRELADLTERFVAREARRDTAG